MQNLILINAQLLQTQRALTQIENLDLIPIINFIIESYTQATHRISFSSIHSLRW